MIKKKTKPMVSDEDLKSDLELKITVDLLDYLFEHLTYNARVKNRAFKYLKAYLRYQGFWKNLPRGTIEHFKDLNYVKQTSPEEEQKTE